MKIFIEREGSSNKIGEKGWGEENLQPVTMDLTELWLSGILRGSKK